MSVDWGAGSYEIAAQELAPAAATLVTTAAPAAGERVLDLACGTGNAALLAAQRGAQVIGVDGASRLLEVAARLASERGLELDLRQGDLLALPVSDGGIDTVISCFGIIFASEPVQALREVERVLAPGGRAYISAWVPSGPINAMLGAMGRILARVSPAPPPPRFAWADADTVRGAAVQAGLDLQRTERHDLEIRGTSPEAYVEAGREHPMAIASQGAVEAAGVAAEVREAMIAALRAGNEDPGALLLHSPYVIHELQRA